jgi:DNA-binding IclR family transcriptional regulator
VKGLLNRSLKAIELMASDPHWQRLSEIGTRLEMQRGPTHRLLNEMALLGWIEQDEATERYRLTLKLSLLGQQYLYGSGLPGLVQPILDNVSAQCRELVRMTVIDGKSLVWFASSQGAAPGLMYQPSMAESISLHATANGKAWLATMSDETATQYALNAGLGKAAVLGPRAVTGVESLLKELALTRKRGYGQSLEEAEAGVNAIAVAVRSLPDNRVVGTMSIAGPSQRVGKDRLLQLQSLLEEAGAKLRLVWPLQKAQQ